MDERFGPVAGEMIHVGYNRPELFRVVMKGCDGLRPSSAAVMSFTRDLEFGPLNAKMNPADGQLYVVGFQVWGTTAKALSGLARVRYTGAPRVLMKELTATDKGVVLKFNAKLDKAVAEDPANYSAERWNYRRTEKYGSPHLKLDGSSGQEWMTASSAYLSEDGMSVMVGFPEMKAGVHQMRIGWGIKGADGLPAQNTAYFTPSELETFDARTMGFGGVKVDLTPRAAVAVAMGKASAEEGEKLYQMFGCMACHSTDGNLQGKVGPSWKGLFGSEREIANTKGKKVKADVDYLKESILNPGAKVVRGFEKFDAGMPIYEGILNAVQVESLILYIKTLE
jgi:cytochrome c551/c552